MWVPQTTLQILSFCCLSQPKDNKEHKEIFFTVKFNSHVLKNTKLSEEGLGGGYFAGFSFPKWVVFRWGIFSILRGNIMRGYPSRW